MSYLKYVGIYEFTNYDYKILGEISEHDKNDDHVDTISIKKKQIVKNQYKTIVIADNNTTKIKNNPMTSSKFELRNDYHLIYLKLNKEQVIIALVLLMPTEKESELNNFLTRILSIVSNCHSKKKTTISIPVNTNSINQTLNNELCNEFNLFKSKDMMYNINKDVNEIRRLTRGSISSCINTENNLNELLMKSISIKAQAYEYKTVSNQVLKEARCSSIWMTVIILIIIALAVWVIVSEMICNSLINPLCYINNKEINH